MTDDEGPGFYLVVAGRVIAHASEAVDGPGFSLRADSQADRESPGVNGWRWYDASPLPE